MSRRVRQATAIVAFGVVLAGCGRLLPDGPAGVANRPTVPGVSPPVGSTAGADFGLVDAPVEGGTRSRVTRAAGSLQACVATLEAARVSFVVVPDRVNSGTCGLTAAGQLMVDRGRWRGWRPRRRR